VTEIILPRADVHSRADKVERACAFLRGLAPHKAWAVKVKEHKPKRSDNQNRYLWGVVYATILKDGGEALAGWSAEDLHEYFLGEHFGWETLEGFGKKRIRPIRRSSKLNKIEFMDYVAFIQQRAAELGIYVPDPHELHEVQW
jgi:hypothetical protein